MYGTSRILDFTGDMPREEWLRRRALGVGASEVAAVLGVSKYAGPWTIAARKLGLLGESEDTVATRYGRALEPLVLEMAGERLGATVEPVKLTLGPACGGPLRVSLDGWAVGLGHPVEAKRPFRRLDFDAWEQLELDGFPMPGSPLEEYWWQVQAQVGTCGVEFGTLAGLLRDRLFAAHLPFDSQAWDQVLNEVGEFWRKVELVRADPDMLEAFRRGLVVEPNGADRQEWQRAVEFPERVTVTLDDGAAFDAMAAELRITDAEVAVKLQRIEELKTRITAEAAKHGATKLRSENYEASLVLTKRSTSEYGVGAPREALDRLAALKKEASEIEAALKPFAIRSQSVRVDVKPRR